MGNSAKMYWDKKYQREKGCGKSSGINFRAGRCLSDCFNHSSHLQVRKLRVKNQVISFFLNIFY